MILVWTDYKFEQFEYKGYKMMSKSVNIVLRFKALS